MAIRQDGSTDPAPGTTHASSGHPSSGHASSDCATHEASTFAWTDGHGVAWTIMADAERIGLSSDDETLSLTRPEWRRAISFQPRGGHVVIHVDTGQREIGFMVTTAEARNLFTAMGTQVQSASEVGQAQTAVQSAVQSAAHAARAVPAEGSALWPKMSVLPIAALLLGALAFLPVVGVAFAAGAWICGGLAIRRSPANAAHLHIRVLAKVGIVSAMVGLVISGLGTYTMLQVVDHAGDMAVASTAESAWGWGARAAALIMLLIALSVHEAAHAITAWWCGDGYAKSLGRVTLNPLAHIDPVGTVLLPILLMMINLPVFGYARPVPVRLAGVRRHRRAHILISAAGPVSNLLQAAWCLALLTALGAVLTLIPGAQVAHLADFQPAVQIEGIAGAAVLSAAALMLKLGVGVNILLAVLNLIPIPPLDGSWILEHLFPRTLGAVYARIRPYGFMIFVALIWMPGNLLAYLMVPAVLLFVGCRGLLFVVTGF